MTQGLKSESEIGYFEFDQFSLLISKRELRIGGTPVALPRKAFELLVLLIENRTKVVTFEEMNARVWNGRVLSHGVIPQTIKMIRRALSDDAQVPRYIRSFHGIGYRFIADPAGLTPVAGPVKPRPSSPAGNHHASDNPLSVEFSGYLTRSHGLTGRALDLWQYGCDALDQGDQARLSSVEGLLTQVFGTDCDPSIKAYGVLFSAQAHLVKGEVKQALDRVERFQQTLVGELSQHAKVEFQLTVAHANWAAYNVDRTLISLKNAWVLAASVGTARQVAQCAVTVGRVILNFRLNDFAIRWNMFARDLSSLAGETSIRAAAELNLIAQKVALANDQERLGECPESVWQSILNDVDSALTGLSAESLPLVVHAAFMTNRAIALWRIGRLAESEELLRIQTERFLLGHRLDQFSAASFYLADLLLQFKGPDAALDVCNRAVAVCDRKGVRPHGYANLLSLTSTAADQTGDSKAALSYLQRRGDLRKSVADDKLRDQSAVLASMLFGAIERDL